MMCLHEDSSGVIWIVTSGGVAALKDSKLQVFSEGLAHSVVRKIMEDSEGRLRVGTQGALQQLENAKFRAVAIKNIIDPESENITYAHCIYADREGNSRLGGRSGLNRLR